MRACELALERGVFAQGIRPPTVPVGSSRLRLAVMATHGKDELREAARTLAQAARRGHAPGPAPPAPPREPASRSRAASRPRRARVFDGEADDARAPR